MHRTSSSTTDCASGGKIRSILAKSTSNAARKRSLLDAFETMKLTPPGRSIQNMDSCRKQTGIADMVYTVDERQLLDLWTAISCLGDVREIPDPVVRSELLTQAQIHLTAFVLDLQPLPRGLAGSAPPRTFDA